MLWPRLTLVLGKGGAGKSTVAAALALALCRRRPTVLVELGAPGSAAALLQSHPQPGLSRLRLEPRAELESFIGRLVPLRSLARRMLSSRTFGFVSAALPGLESFLTMRRLSELAAEAAREDSYVIVDGLSTGASEKLLAVGQALKELAPAGKLYRLASELQNFIDDPNRFGVRVVIRPERLGLKEGLLAHQHLESELAPSSLGAILNGFYPPLLSPTEMLGIAQLGPEQARLARWRTGLQRRSQDALATLEAAGVEVQTLPALGSGQLAFGELERLSRILAKSIEV